MKTIQEQIAVMQHYADGGKVELADSGSLSGWRWIIDPSWNWYIHDYRIAEEADPYAELKAAAADPTKQIRMKEVPDWTDAGHGWSWFFQPEDYEIRDKPKPMKKVKLFAWHDKTDGDLIWRHAGHIMESIWNRVPSEDKEIEVAA